jgi:signal transduction histidine kinase
MSEAQNHILVVDDDAFVREMLREILAGGGYRGTAAENGAVALAEFDRSQNVDLILSDMNMPRLNGLGLIREIRLRKSSIPIIILTSNEEVTVALEAIRSGADDYLLKDENIEGTVPFSVEKAIQKHRLKIQNQQLLSDLAEKNRELETSNRTLSELNQLKNKFIGIAAHDLRNPLGVIKGLCEILTDEDFADLTKGERREYLDMIYATALEMLGLVNDLLDVSIIESGRLEIRHEPGYFRELLDQRIRIHKIAADKKGLTITTDFDDGPEAWFDAHRIAQAFDNLMTNAIKFSPPDSTIGVILHHGAQGVTIGVSDQGPGLSPEDRSRLFGDFQRLSAKPTAGEKSTGLGLAIVKKVIEAHKGILRVESEVGAGSCFRFQLPLHREAPAGDSE